MDYAGVRESADTSRVVGKGGRKRKITVLQNEYCPFPGGNIVSLDWLIQQWTVTIKTLSEKSLRWLIQEVVSSIQNKFNAADSFNGKGFHLLP